MKTLLALCLFFLSLGVQAKEVLPVFGHLVVFHCVPETAGCSSDAPDRVESKQLILTGEGLLQGQEIFKREIDGQSVTVILSGTKLSSGDYFFRADMTYGKIGSNEFKTKRLGNIFTSRFRSLGQVYWGGEAVAEGVHVDFGFGYDSN